MWLLVPLAFLAIDCALGQTTLGVAAVGGTVRDQSGALVAAAAVTLTGETKGLIRKSESDASGSFLFPAVIAGVYSLLVEKHGFSSEQMRGLGIEVGQQASVDITLRVGNIRTAVAVMPPSRTELAADSSTIGSLVDSDQVRELPLNGRNFLQLGLLVATAVDVNPASNLFTSNVRPPSRTIVLPGTLPASVGYSLNGLSIRGSRDGELAVSPW